MRIGREATSVEIGRYKEAMKADPCAYCGAPSVALDHIQARQRGGSNRWWNRAGICTRCNTIKGVRSVLGMLAYGGWLREQWAAEDAARAGWRGL